MHTFPPVLLTFPSTPHTRLDTVTDQFPNCNVKGIAITMRSAIGLATARQLRVGGRLSVCRAARFAAHATGQSTTAIPTGYRFAAVFIRGFAQARGGTKKLDASTEPKPKPKPREFAKKLATAARKKTPAKKKKTTKAAAAKKAAEKKATAKRIAAKKAAAAKQAALSDEEKLKIKIKALKKRALLTEPTRQCETAWAVFMSRTLKDKLTGKPSSETGSLAMTLPEVAKEFKALPAAEVEVSWAKPGTPCPSWVASH